MLSTLILQLMQELNLNEDLLKKDNSGGYTLSIHENYAVILANTDDGCLFKSSFAKVPKNPTQEENLIMRGMHANLFGRGTGNAVLGLTPDGEMMTLTYFFNSQGHYKDFKLCLENFLNYLDFWHDETIKISKT